MRAVLCCCWSDWAWLEAWLQWAGWTPHILCAQCPVWHVHNLERGMNDFLYLHTVCPRSSDPIYIVIYKMGHYFLGIQYNLFISFLIFLSFLFSYCSSFSHLWLCLCLCLCVCISVFICVSASLVSMSASLCHFVFLCVCICDCVFLWLYLTEIPSYCDFILL